MKLTKIFFIAGITTALSCGSALAESGVIKVTATIRTQDTNSIAGKNEISQEGTVVWDTTNLYGLISTAVANAGTNGTGIDSTNLPSSGYIVYNPNGTDGNVYGTFYVTNKSGSSYPLSGVDTNGNYYSFIELDTYLDSTVNPTTNAITNSGISAGLVNLGFSDNFNGVQTGQYNTVNGGGFEAGMSTALFYAHDNPYAYDGGNNPNAFYGNDNALEIRGIARIVFTYKKGDASWSSIMLQGTGNAIVESSQNAIVTSGSLFLSQ